MAKSKSGRRGFLKGAVAGAAAFAAQSASGQQQVAQNTQGAAAAPERAPAAVNEARTVDRPGSDFMVDVTKALGGLAALIESATSR